MFMRWRRQPYKDTKLVYLKANEIYLRFPFTAYFIHRRRHQKDIVGDLNREILTKSMAQKEQAVQLFDFWVTKACNSQDLKSSTKV